MTKWLRRASVAAVIVLWVTVLLVLVFWQRSYGTLDWLHLLSGSGEHELQALHLLSGSGFVCIDRYHIRNPSDPSMRFSEEDMDTGWTSNPIYASPTPPITVRKFWPSVERGGWQQPLAAHPRSQQFAVARISVYVPYVFLLLCLIITSAAATFMVYRIRKPRERQ